MRRLLLPIALIALALSARAQVFQGRVDCEELNVYMVMDFEHGQTLAPGHELVGEVSGYMAKNGNGFYWLVTSAKVSGKKATLTMINDYGSEDLTATVVQKNDSTYIFTAGKGSTIKLPNKGKWQKMPKEMTFVRIKN